jgi:hypothetical protein
LLPPDKPAPNELSFSLFLGGVALPRHPKKEKKIMIVEKGANATFETTPYLYQDHKKC